MFKIIFLLLLFSLEVLYAKFSFHIATDPHMFQRKYGNENFKINNNFKELTCQGIINHVKGDFIIVAGDLDPFFRVRESIRKKLNIPFFPVVGNHDVPGTNNLASSYLSKEKIVKGYPEKNWTDTFELVQYNRDNLGLKLPSAYREWHWGPIIKSNYNPSKKIGQIVKTTLLQDKKNLNQFIMNKDGKEKEELTFIQDGKSYKSAYDKKGVIGSKYTSYAFNYQNVMIVIIDLYAGNSWGARGMGVVSKPRLEWLEEQLNRAKKDSKINHVLVFAHEPIWLENATLYKVINGKKLWKLMSSYDKVKFYFSGHRHKVYTVKKDGIWEIGASSSNLTKRNVFATIYVDKMHIECQLIQTKSGKVDDYKLLEQIEL